MVITDNPAKWTSKYGSLVTTVCGIGTADGLNERGLGAHMLYLTATNFGQRDPSKPGMQAGLWAQYALDNAATVGEVLALLDKIQVVISKPADIRRRSTSRWKMQAAIPPLLNLSTAKRWSTTVVSFA